MPDIGRVAARIREVAAIEILPRFRKLTAGEMHEKQPGQLVTVLPPRTSASAKSQGPWQMA